MKLTPAKRKSLEVLRDHGPITPGSFAHIRWPDSPSWKRHARCGPKGSTVGTGIRLKAGAVLWALRDEGLARRPGVFSFEHDNSFEITRAGLEALEGES